MKISVMNLCKEKKGILKICFVCLVGWLVGFMTCQVLGYLMIYEAFCMDVTQG